MLELSESLRTADGGDVMRMMLGFMLPAVVDAEATAHIGAGRHGRTATRTTQRNGISGWNSVAGSPFADLPRGSLPRRYRRAASQWRLRHGLEPALVGPG